MATGALLLSGLVGLGVATVAADFSGIVFFATYSGIGTYLAIRRPSNSIGWSLVAIGWGLVLGRIRVDVPVDALASGQLDPGQAMKTWANGWGWSLAFVAMLRILLVFPTDRMPDGGGRWPARVLFGSAVGMAVLLAVAPAMSVIPAETGVAVDVPNPFALGPGLPAWALVPGPAILSGILFMFVVAGMAGLIGRLRGSVGLERLQYRWLVAAVAVVAIATIIWAVDALVLQNATTISLIIVIVAYPAIPVAIGVAIMRYRLYDIDRIISRTIAYAVVSAVLLAVFGLAVLILSGALSSVAGGQSIAVAGSTLIAYAAFQPVLGRVRRTVDRRFDRARYDGERTATVFAARLRDETDVDAVIEDLAVTARAVVAPTSLALWLRPRDVSS